jgi:hypothetical protein
MREATSSVEKQLADARQSVDGVIEEAKPAADPIAYDAGGLPLVTADASAEPSTEATAGLNGASLPAETPAAAPGETAATPPAGTPSEPGRATEKSGA